MSELISVIIPVYNGARDLPLCLDSLLAQTYRNLELILVNDGSTDDTASVCDAYAARDSRIRVITKPNGGVSSARNAGLQAAHGELIGFADSDDECRPEMYAKLYEALTAAHADVAMCGYLEELPVEGAAPLVRGCTPRAAGDAHDAVMQVLRRDRWFTALWNKLFRREALIRDGRLLAFDETLAVGEDETWLLRMLPGITKAAYVPEALYRWRTRPDSASRTAFLNERTMSVLRAKQMSIRLTETMGKDAAELAKSRLLNDCYHLKVYAYREHNKKALREVRSEFRKVRHAWLVSDDVPLLRKAKVLCMDLMIALHCPSGWVDRVFFLRRQHG